MTNVWDNTTIAPEITQFMQQFGIDVANTTGLDISVLAGNAANGAGITVVPAVTLTLTDNATNYICLDTALLVLVVKANSTTAGFVALYQVTVLNGQIVTVLDLRTMYYPAGNPPQRSYDIASYFLGKPTSSQVILRLRMIRALTFDVNMLASLCTARVAATASTTFNIAKNGTNFCTIVFGIAGVEGAFTAAVPPAFAVGDLLTVTAPAGADATLADIGFILAAALVL